jgi:hypothetical protein
VIARLCKLLAPVVVVGAIAFAVPPPADALNVAKPICTIAGLVSGVAGKLCSVVSHAGGALKAGQKLLGGHIGGALESLSGAGTAAKAVGVGLMLTSIVGWVTGGANFVLHETAKFIFATTRPQLQSTWFSVSYWRMAALSALLTLPFLFAAVIQAVIRSDPQLLARSTLGYLPLGMLSVAIAAPVTMLLLSASDEMSAIVSGAAGSAGGSFLDKATFATGGLTAVSGSTFLALFVGLLTVAATVTLWVELLVRSAAVDVVVLMLPLFFAALVWPARRIWAVRAVELLVALILSKFVIVAVLTLGGAALGHATLPDPVAGLSGVTLVMLAAFSPWALLRLLPLHELAGGLESLRDRSQMLPSLASADEVTPIAHSVLRQLPAAAIDSAPVRDEPAAAEAAVRRLDHDDPGQTASAGAAAEAAASTNPGASPAAPVAAGLGEHGPPSTEGAGPQHDDRRPMEAFWNTESGGWPVLHLPTPPSHPPIGPDPDQPPAQNDPTPDDQQRRPPPQDGDL